MTDVPREQKDSDEKRTGRWLTAVFIGGLILFGILVLFTPSTPSDTTKLAYGEFRTEVTKNAIQDATINQKSGTIHGTLKANGKPYVTQGPPGGLPDADLALLDQHKVERNYVSTKTNPLGGVLLYLLPFVLLIGLWVWLVRGTDKRMTGATAFTKSKARVQRTERPKTTFTDIAGYEGVKEEIHEIVDFLRDPTRFQAVGAHVPKGVLLVGPPGTGKTLFARAIAGEADVPFISITGSEFLEMFVGVGAARVRDLFATARKEMPSIIFVDEIDAVGRKRGAGLGGGHDEREQTLNQLLAEMDGFEANEGIIVLAATNRPDVLDPALLRAGRFDRQVVIPLPTVTERRAILEVHARDKHFATDIDLDLIARGTPGMSGAELANLLNEAALIAIRRGSAVISKLHLDAARDRVLLGLRRASLVLTPAEKHMVAVHEAGHAVLAAALPHADPVHKVSILPTGMALGLTEQVPVTERQLLQRSDLEDALAVRLGGRAAEQVVFGEASTGAQDDLVSATGLARRMVREWGMSPALGPMAWGSEGAVFLGEDLVHTRDYSDETARVIDEEVGGLLTAQAARAAAELTRRRGALDALTNALLEHETVGGDEVARIVGSVTDISPRGDRSDQRHGSATRAAGDPTRG
jgi:cell division protease FtsH